MKNEERNNLELYGQRNETIFQVMGSLKLMNVKVKNFVGKLEKVKDDDMTKQRELNLLFDVIRQDVNFFEKEHKNIIAMDIHIPSVDLFATNTKLLCLGVDVYTIKEMRQISVYLYRMADKMIKDLVQLRKENEDIMRSIRARNGKYYFNRK